MQNVNFFLQKEIKPRKLFYNLKKYLTRKEAIIITGPRQAGKTSLMFLLAQFIIKQELGRVFFYDLEDPADLQLWEDFSFIRTIPSGSFVFIDEIQHHPDPGKLIKLAVDHRGGEIKLVVSGSSSLQIKEKFAPATVGRKIEFLLLPLDFEEFLLFKGREDLAAHLQKVPYEVAAPFLEEFLIFGGYPAICLAPDRETKLMLLSEIFSSLLYKDIIPLFKLKKPDAFSKTFRLLAARTGSPVNLSELAWEAGLSRPALNSYLEALKLTYLIFPLQPFSPNPSTQLRKRQKFYLADPGLRNWAISNFLPLSLRNDTGALAENFVFLELIKNLPPGSALGYWKGRAGAEVDFVLDGRLPVEVKFSGSSRLLLPRSLISFIEKFSPKKAFVVTKTGRGSRTYKQTEIFYLPAYLSSFIASEVATVSL